MDHIRKSHAELVDEVELYKKQSGHPDDGNKKNDKARNHQKTIVQMLSKFSTEEVCSEKLLFRKKCYFEK